MIYRVLALATVMLVLLLTVGYVNLESTVKGATIGGALAVTARGRTVTLRAHAFRPNRTYLILTVR